MTSEYWDPTEQVFHWIRTKQAGCAFAQALATNRETKSWLTVTLEKRPRTEPDVQDLEDLLIAAVADDEKHAAMVVFEDVETPQDLVSLLTTLCSHESWTIYEPREVGPSAGGLRRVAVGLRWTTPEKKTSFVLGFGPFGFLPPTRRAPYCTLTIPTCPKSKWTKQSEPDQLHLCDMREAAFTETERRKLDSETEQWRKSLVKAPDNDAAKARVTFVFPYKFRSSLRLPQQSSST